MSERRDFFRTTVTVLAGMWAGAKSSLGQQVHRQHPQQKPPSANGQPASVQRGVAREQRQPPTAIAGAKTPAAFNIPVETPDLPKLPHTMVDGWKEFHLVAEPVRFEIVPGRFVYEWELHQAGTFFYHSHMPMQEMMGMIGLFVMHPKIAFEPHCDRDFGIVLQEWVLLPNNTVPNTLSMEFNWLTFNGKSGPATTPMIVKQGERVRIRMINIGMDHHPIHLHGNQFVVTGTEGGRGLVDGWVSQNTVIVGVAQARDIEFDAKYAGDWMLHCHLPHHMMNQMVSMVGPLSHGAHSHGIATGAGMEEGMGIVTRGDALSSDLGPSLGRGLGMAADTDRATSSLVGSGAKRDKGAHQQGTDHKGHGVAPGGHTGQTGAEPFDPLKDVYPKDDAAKKRVPAYPQDMWMTEDEKYRKPQTFGLSQENPISTTKGDGKVMPIGYSRIYLHSSF